MKNKKLFLPSIILVAAILISAVYLFASSIAKKPTVTEGEFSFSITYELDGQTVTINDVYKAYYDRNDGYADSKSRIYEGVMLSTGENSSIFTIKKEGQTRIELHTNFYADHLMGDPWYDYFEDGDEFAPKAYYYDEEEQEFYDDETLLAHGFKLISYEYPAPIENKLTFSHFSYFSAEIVFPTLLIAFLAWLSIIIFVKKEKDLQRRAIDIVSVVLNFVISFTFIPVITIFACFIDIEGGGPDFYYQALYFIPVVSALGIAASVALRRKGYRIASLASQFIGPVYFAVYLIICMIIGVN